MTAINVHVLTDEELTQIIDDTFADQPFMIWSFWMVTQQARRICKGERERWIYRSMIEEDFMRLMSQA